MASTRYEPITPKLLKNKLFSFIVKIFLNSGYVMSETQKFERWHYWRSAFITFSIVLSSIFGVVTWAKASVSSLSLAITCTLLATSIAYVNIFFRRRRLGRMLNFLQEDLEKLMINADEREKLMFDEICKFMFITWKLLYIPTSLGLTLLYLDSFYRIVFDLESSINYAVTDNEVKTKWLIGQIFPYRVLHDDLCLGLVFPLFNISLAAFYIPLWPIAITNLMLYVNFKWKIMHKRMSEMDISKVILEPNEAVVYSSLVSENDRINYLRTRLCKFCISEQIRIRWFMDKLQNLIQIPVFMDFVIYSIIICFVLYEIATGNHSEADLAYLALFMIVVSIIVWLNHWNGTLVSENLLYSIILLEELIYQNPLGDSVNSYAMGFAVYSSDWYTYSLDVQKMILLIMLITKDPVEITAFIIRLHVTTFIDIIRAAYSYFNLLRN